MKEQQLEFPFLRRETFYSGRSMVQLKLSFPEFFRVIIGISDQCVLPMGTEFPEDAENECITEASVREQIAGLNKSGEKDE